jgi:hypothetical protein
MWRPIILIAVLVIAGCHAFQPDFMTRVREDCSVGQQWACDLIASLNNPLPMGDSELPKIVGAHAERAIGLSANVSDRSEHVVY